MKHRHVKKKAKKKSKLFALINNGQVRKAIYITLRTLATFKRFPIESSLISCSMPIIPDIVELLLVVKSGYENNCEQQSINATRSKVVVCLEALLLVTCFAKNILYRQLFHHDHSRSDFWVRSV